MTTRKESIVNRKAANKKRVITISSLALLVLVSIVTIFMINKVSGERDVTSIEQVLPSSSQAIFISASNQESWDYFNALANTNYEFIPDTKTLGYAMNNNTPILYVSGDTTKIKEFLRVKNIPYTEKNDVIALIKDPKAFTEDGIGKQDSYQILAKKGSNKSFGYVDFKSLAQGNDKKLSYNIPQLGIWSGTFKQGKWDGTIDKVDNSLINEKESSLQVIGNPTYRNFIDSYSYKKSGNTAKGEIRVETYNAMREPKYTTAMNWFNFEINENKMSFTMTQMKDQ